MHTGLVTEGEFLEMARAVSNAWLTRKGQAIRDAVTPEQAAQMVSPETGASWNSITKALTVPEMAGYRLPTVAEVLAINGREYPEWTHGKEYAGQHWADSSIFTYRARVVYPDNRVEWHNASASNAGIAFRLIKGGVK